MIASILAKFINTRGAWSVASIAVKVKLNCEHGGPGRVEYSFSWAQGCATPVTDSRSQLLQVLISAQLFFPCLHTWNGLCLELIKKRGKAQVKGKWKDKLKEFLVVFVPPTSPFSLCHYWFVLLHSFVRMIAVLFWDFPYPVEASSPTCYTFYVAICSGKKNWKTFALMHERVTRKCDGFVHFYPWMDPERNQNNWRAWQFSHITWLE